AGLFEDHQRILETPLGLVGAFAVEVPAAELSETLGEDVRGVQRPCQGECLAEIFPRMGVVLTRPQRAEIEERLPLGEAIAVSSRARQDGLEVRARAVEVAEGGERPAACSPELHRWFARAAR